MALTSRRPEKHTQDYPNLQSIDNRNWSGVWAGTLNLLPADPQDIFIDQIVEYSLNQKILPPQKFITTPTQAIYQTYILFPILSASHLFYL